MQLISIIPKRLSRIVGVFLLLILSLSSFFYIGTIQASESPWQVVKGKDKVTKPLVMPWFGPAPYLYTISNHQNEIIFAPYTPFYIEPWTPKGKQEGKYVWKLSLNTFSSEPILYKNFISWHPKLYGKPIKLWEKLVELQTNYDLTKDNLIGETLVEDIAFNTQYKKYEMQLSITGFKRFQSGLFKLGFLNKKNPKNNKSLFYSGIIHLKFFDLSNKEALTVELIKKFNNWNYPLRNDPKKYTIPSIIASFSKLYFLPDSRPCFMIVSPIYKGNIYKARSRVEDNTFRVIIP